MHDKSLPRLTRRTSFLLILYAITILLFVAWYSVRSFFWGLLYYYDLVSVLIFFPYCLLGSFWLWKAGVLLKKSNPNGVGLGIRGVVWMMFPELLIGVSFFGGYSGINNALAILVPLAFVIVNMFLLWSLSVLRRFLSPNGIVEGKALKVSEKQAREKFVDFFLGFFTSFALYWGSFFFHGNLLLLHVIIPMSFLVFLLLYWKLRRGWLWLVMGLLSGWGVSIFIQLIRH